MLAKLSFLFLVLSVTHGRAKVTTVETLLISNIYQTLNSLTEHYHENMIFEAIEPGHWIVGFENAENCSSKIKKNFSYRLSPNQKSLFISLPQCYDHNINISVSSSSPISIKNFRDLLNWKFLLDLKKADTYSITSKPSFLEVSKSLDSFNLLANADRLGNGFFSHCKLTAISESCSISWNTTGEFRSRFEKPQYYFINARPVARSYFASYVERYLNYAFSYPGRLTDSYGLVKFAETHQH